MRIVTSQKLIDKYPGKDVLGLLKTITDNVDVLPLADYVATKMHCNQINDDILIVGGPDVIPFAEIPNPAMDPDAMVLSDAPYACTKDSTYLVPDKVIARLPDEQVNATFEYLETVVKYQVGYMTTVKSSNQGWFQIVASVWKGIGDWMKTQFNMNSQYVAPPIVAPSLNPTEVNTKFAYVNLHGAQQTPYYYGQSGNTYPIAMMPVGGYFKGTLGFIEACYGGYITGRNKELSIPMMGLFSGAVGFVCSTMVAYGPSNPPASAADLLAQKFFINVQSGQNLGTAFLNAKKDFASELLRREGSLDGSNRKTLLEFHLYSVPSITI